jgi:hypothetical protein
MPAAANLIHLSSTATKLLSFFATYFASAVEFEPRALAGG